MRVGPHHKAGAPVTEMAHGHLFRCGLGMQVDDHRIGGLTERARFEGAFHSCEGIVQGVHVNPAEKIDHEHASPPLDLE